MITLIPVLMSLPYLVLAFPTLSESEVQNWLWAMSNLVTNNSSVSQKVTAKANMSMGSDLTMMNKHCKFSKWDWLRLHSFWYDFSPEFWLTDSDTSLACILPPSLGLQQALPCHNDFLVYSTTTSCLFIATCWTANIWSNLETCLQIQANQPLDAQPA
jgi:hypothetical protein